MSEGIIDDGFWADQRVLITGADGFVGRWAARAVATTPAALLLCDRDAPDPRAVFIERPTRDAEGFALDLLDAGRVASAVALHRPTVVLHLSGMSGVAEAYDDPRAAFDANVTATQNLLDALRLYNDGSPGRLQSVVHLSSHAVYGLQARTPTPESAPLNARRVGPAGRACGDIMARAYADSFGLPLAVARVAETFGGDDPREGTLVSSCIGDAFGGDAPVLRGSGLDAADFLHVDDAVRGVMLLAERVADDPEICGSAFNFGPDEPITLIELARRVLRRAGRPDLEPVVAGSHDGATTEHMDNTDAKRLLGWSQAMTLDEAIEETLTWYAARARVA